MKNFKTSLHIMLSFASLLGFLGGWATLAHSRKPVQHTASISTTTTQTLDPLPPLAPLPAMNGNSVSSGNSSPDQFSISPQVQVQVQQPSRLRSRPVFTTSGS